jgi:hypothetical protein
MTEPGSSAGRRDPAARRSGARGPERAGRGADPGPALRASDADRERTAAALRRHHLDGRIDTDELQERIERCFAARTLDDLGALTADLPGDERARRPAAPAGAHRGGGVPVVAIVALLALAFLASVAAARHGHPGPFPILAVLLAIRVLRPRRAWGRRA